MVLNDLAALTVEQGEGEVPAMDRTDMLATISGTFGYLLDYFTSYTDDTELAHLCAETKALDALTREELRQRFGKTPVSVHNV